MNEKDNKWDLSDLEKEIDSTVDTLLVNKTEQANQVTPPQKTHSSPQETNITDKPSFPVEKEIDATVDSFLVERTEQADQVTPPQKIYPSAQEAGMTERPSPPSSTSQAQTMQPVSGELQQKLEEVEAQLLTLEWDINSKHLNNAITHLQDLRKLSHVGDDLEKVIILIQKVLHQLILDESTLTPAALKFLQKSWKAIKGMTDQRFSFEIDKDILVRELIAEFEKLRIDEAPQERIARREVQQAPTEPIGLGLGEERLAEQSSVKAQISFAELDNFMNKIENLVQVINEERKKLSSIYQEITNFKDDLQNKMISGGKFQKESQEEIVELDKRLATEPYNPSDFELQPSIDTPILAVSLFKVSGVIFGLPEKQIMRSFPIKKWVSEFFIERGKVKLKNNEIPLFDICQVFKLKPSTEENPHVLLLKGRENHPAAVIIDQAISREEIEFQSVEGRPYILGQGVSRSGRVWILDAEQISP